MGQDKDYKEIINYFSTLKRILIDKVFPVVIGEIGINNNHFFKNSIRQFLYSIFSISSENEGILPCLWDISEKYEGEMDNYIYDYDEILVSIFTYDKSQNWNEIDINKPGKKQYDGSFTYTIDATNIECYNYIEAVSFWGTNFVALNYLTVIYKENYNFFDYKSYKSAVLKETNK